MLKCIERVEAWCNRNGIKLNHSKSGIMCIRADRRTPQPLLKTNIKGIPIVKSLKYLGVWLDDSLKMDVNE